jgi:ABC-type multidrug transport system ATPase subunit
LNCLTGKLRKGVSGHINLKGANGKHLKMCTIPQKDHLLEQLTVEENLWFASKIKNPEYGFDHAKNIGRVIMSYWACKEAPPPDAAL